MEIHYHTDSSRNYHILNTETRAHLSCTPNKESIEIDQFKDLGGSPVFFTDHKGIYELNFAT